MHLDEFCWCNNGEWCEVTENNQRSVVWGSINYKVIMIEKCWVIGQKPPSPSVKIPLTSIHGRMRRRHRHSYKEGQFLTIPRKEAWTLFNVVEHIGPPEHPGTREQSCRVSMKAALSISSHGSPTYLKNLFTISLGNKVT